MTKIVLNHLNIDRKAHVFQLKNILLNRERVNKSGKIWEFENDCMD